MFRYVMMSSGRILGQIVRLNASVSQVPQYILEEAESSGTEAGTIHSECQGMIFLGKFWPALQHAVRVLVLGNCTWHMYVDPALVPTKRVHSCLR